MSVTAGDVLYVKPKHQNTIPENDPLKQINLPPSFLWQAGSRSISFILFSFLILLFSSFLFFFLRLGFSLACLLACENIYIHTYIRSRVL